MTEVNDFTFPYHGNRYLRSNGIGELKRLSYCKVFLQLQCVVPSHCFLPLTKPLVFNTSSNGENCIFSEASGWQPVAWLMTVTEESLVAATM